MQGKVQQMVDALTAPLSDTAKALKDIVYRIDPDEVPLLAGPRVLTKRQKKTLLRLEGQYAELAKEMRRLERKLDAMARRRLKLSARIGELRPVSGANRVLTEWLVQELNADHPEEPESFTVTGP